MPQINFDANSVPESSYDPLPAGDYMVYISQTEVATSDKGNELLKVTFDVIQPEQYQGRKVFSNYTIGGPSQSAIATGQSILKQVCKAVGVMHVADSQQLHDIPLNIRVVVREYQGKVGNEPKAYWSTQSAPPPPPKSVAAPPRPGAPGMTQPWQQPPQQQAPQPWQPQAAAPAPQQYAPPPQQQAPAQQHFNLQPTYKGGPIPGAPTQQPHPPVQQYQPPQAQAPYQQPPQPQQYAPAQAPLATPPWAQSLPPAAQQGHPPEEVMYDEHGNRIPF